MKSNFDDILKKKWEEKQFPVDENHRAEMLELLHNQKRRRVFPFWWLSGLIVVVAMSGYFLLNDRDTTIDFKDQKTESHQAAEGYATKSEALHADMPDSKNVASEDPSDINSENIHANTKLRQNTSSNNVNNSKQNIKTNNSNQNSQTSDHQSKENVVSPPSSAPGHFLVDEEAVSSFVIQSNAVAVRVYESDEALAEALKKEKTSSQRFSGSQTEPINTLPISDIDYSSKPSLDKIESLSKGRSSFQFFGETGVGLIMASEPYFNSGWKFRVGGGMSFRPALSKFDFNLSAGYLFQNGGFEYERTSTFDQLGFWVRSSSNRLKPDKLHFIYSKLGTQYHLRRHLFAAHGGIQWLYGSQGEISVVTQDQVTSEVTESTQYAWLKTDGLQKVHWTVDVSYGYQITPRLSAVVGTDIYFSPFTVEDPALEAEGYSWDGKHSRFQPFVTLNYLIYGLW